MQNFPLNLLTLPYWWYTTGAAILFSWNKRKYHYYLQKTGLVALARHFGEPLYKDYTRSGMVISFFIRIFLLAAKSVIFAVKLLFLAIFDLFYFFILPFIVAMIIFQLLP